jgi:hypothetical protein
VAYRGGRDTGKLRDIPDGRHSELRTC